MGYAQNRQESIPPHLDMGIFLGNKSFVKQVAD